MLKNLSIFFFVVFLFSAFLNAQEKTYMRTDGKFFKANQLPSSEEVYKVKRSLVDRDVKLHKPSSINQIASPTGLIDTLGYGFEGDSDFGAFGQDVFLQWFKAPAELIVKGFAYLTYDDESVVDGARFEGKIVSVNLTEAELLAFGDQNIGYYPGDNVAGITAFTDNLDRNGDWVNVGTWTGGEPFGIDIWGDFGFGAVTEPILDEWIWIQTNSLYEPTIGADEIFGIAYKNTSTNLAQTDAAGDRLGVSAENNVGWPGWKFYAAYRLDNTRADKGWWSRTYTWYFLVEVDIIGDPPPTVESFTTLPSGLDEGPFTVDAVIVDENPGDPSQAGISSASLFWSLDGSTWNEVAMTGTMPNYTAEIPAQVAGETVSYYIEATDLGAHTSISGTKSFYIFAPSDANTLVVFNGFDAVSGYPVAYYFGSGEWPANYNFFLFDHDKWGYGALTAGVVDNYTNIVEICTNGPSDINSDVIRTWLEADGTRNYMLAGDEWLGSQTGWTNRTYAAGDFQFDILGINADYNDINYGATGDEQLPSEVFPEEGSLLGGPLFDLYTQVSSDSGWTAPMIYDPYWEMGVTNWLDAVDFEDDVEVDMMGAPLTGPNQVIGGHRTLSAGNKIAFFAFDPLSLDSDTETEEEYYWYGFSDQAPQVQTLIWFGVTTGIERVNDLVPGTYALGQNYPNPFNPSTTINFALPQTSNVVLKVYDVLGSEVATLLNGEKAAGNYEVSFDASKLASGLYIYTLNTGNFTASKKMMLIK